MAQKLTKADFYLLIYINRYWRIRPLEGFEDEEAHLLFRTERCGLDLDVARDYVKVSDLTRKILAIIRSYPPEESPDDEDSDIEAGPEGTSGSETDEEENEQEVSPS